MPSFDVVSEVNMQEVANAVNQATREVETRFDFKGTNATFNLDDAITSELQELVFLYPGFLLPVEQAECEA